jgi:dihydroneopterin aldolase
MVFYGFHGVNPEEREQGQRFAVDLTIWIDLTSAAESDNLEDTLSYATVYKQVRAVVEGEPSKLLEHLAGRIGRAVLEDTRVQRVRVLLTKLMPPIKGMTTGTSAVELDLEGVAGW